MGGFGLHVSGQGQGLAAGK